MGHPKTFRRRRSLRLEGFDYRYPGPYHVVLGTFQRQPLLATAPLIEALVGELAAVATAMGATVYAYCFMPDHAHLLVALPGGVYLSQFVQEFKGRSTRVFWHHGGTGRLWQRGFYDHILRAEEDVHAMARYIMANPVRRGLVQDFREYVGSGSLVFRRDDLS
ncbi:MAG: transposase [Candidatus Bipolaricaulis sp.]|nr:transposase [Candidatus Bipolaricaulis sp.]MDY0392190.1 transposase [Candidatus Bipolaricaulis sp.]HRR38964.1 transposase [Rectinema sp.]HRS14594.1 transposase [Candidatus Bipolaricaulis sp.]